MILCTKKKFFKAIIALLVCIAVIYAEPAGAVVIEPDPDLHSVMGDLHALAVAMRLYHDSTRRTQPPGLEELARYLRRPLPDGWPADYRTATVRGGWWVGRRVPDFSTARRFLRNNALSLGLYEQEGQSAWLGGAFVWMNAVPFNANAFLIRVAQGEGDDRHYLFFNLPDTEYYWRSGLTYTAEARAEALRRFGSNATGPFVIPAAPPSAQITVRASPVELPPDFTVSADEEEIDMRLGGILVNPIRRSNDRDRDR